MRRYGWLVLAWGAHAAASECGLYIAKSSAKPLKKGSTGVRLGMYAGKKIVRGDAVAPPELAIQVLSFEAHHTRLGANHTSSPPPKRLARGIAQVEDMFWVPSSTGGQFEEGVFGKDGGTTEADVWNTNPSVTAIPGSGALSNQHVGSVLAVWKEEYCHMRVPQEPQLPKQPHAGRGAYTNYYNLTALATMDIEPGMEILLDFGDHTDPWLYDPPHPETEDEETQGPLHLMDYKKLDQVVENMFQFFDKYKEELTPDAKTAMYDFLVKDVLEAAAGHKAEFVKKALPKDADDLHLVKKAGGTLLYNVPDLKRDLSWLRENGQCMDGLEAKPSTIPEAGRGAFATHDFSKDEFVAPMPLLQIADREILNMRNLVVDKENYVLGYVNETVVTHQLLLNYCFGHPNSTVLLFPLSSVTNFINHASGDKANVKIIWSKAPWLQQEEVDKWKQGNPLYTFDVRLHQSIGLGFDVIATRNIAQGDEIFIDYGDDWVQAWEDHVQQWRTKYKDLEEWPARAVDINANFVDKPFDTPEDKPTYPDHVQTFCYLEEMQVPMGQPRRRTILDKETGKEQEVDIYLYKKETVAAWEGDQLRPCQVLERKETKDAFFYNYTVLVMDAMDVEGKHVSIEVPHKSIRFYDRSFLSDQSDKSIPSFRYPMRIPDPLLPEAWKNLETKADFIKKMNTHFTKKEMDKDDVEDKNHTNDVKDKNHTDNNDDDSEDD